MNPYVIIGAVAATVLLILGSAYGGYDFGVTTTRAAQLEADLKRADKVIVRVQKEIVVQDRIVTKYVQTVQTVHTETERIVHEIDTNVSPDCVLPPDFIVRLHALSRGTTIQALGLTADAGKGVGCRATLDALAAEYRNHRLDAEQLNAIIDREDALDQLDSSTQANQGKSP